MNELKQKKLHLKLGGIMLLAIILGQALFAPFLRLPHRRARF
jgi:hypothetical protein